MCRALRYIGNQIHTPPVFCFFLFFFWDMRRSPFPTSTWIRQTTQLCIFCSLPRSPSLTSSASWSALRCISSSSLRMSASSAMVGVGVGGVPGLGRQWWVWPRNLERSRFEHVRAYMCTGRCAQLGEGLNGPYSVSVTHLLSWKPYPDRSPQNYAFSPKVTMNAYLPTLQWRWIPVCLWNIF